MRALALLVGILPGMAVAAVQGEPSAPWPTLPGDQPRELVRECTGPATWNVTMAGNVDGPACRDVVGYAALRRFWQPNREVSIANLGETSIANPRLVVNDSRDWQTAADIAAEATRGWSRTADRARAVYEFQRRRRFHACTWDAEVHDAAKVFNVYGYTLCGNDATVLSDLWTFAGVPSRRGWPVGHVVSEALYDGGWHLLDGDEHCLFLLRDNETIASEADVVRDHDLIKRTHTYGILQPDNPLLDQFSASLYGHRGERPPRRHSGPSVHTMDWSLPPGASITWRWGHVGKQYTGGDTSVDKYGKDGDGDLLKGWGARAYALMCNAELEYQPDLGRAAGRAAIIEAVNLAAPDGQPSLRAAV
ncbi:MAG: hypothetical protein HUU35_13050, partial [Armatimonadetes bacterium]|nr:hypothetical protein [Armatimonadota bacterium]